MKAIIIGASSGIGRALALQMAEQQHQVGLIGRRTELLEQLKDQYPEQFMVSAFDITAGQPALEKLEQLANSLGGIDILIMSAGTGELNEALDFELERSTIDLNVTAFNQVMVWAYQYFAGQGQGQIVAISSIAGLRGNAIAPAYNASKAYQISYLAGLRQKARKQKLQLTITDVRPGFVATDMAKGDQKFWVARPEKAALQILDAINRKRNVIYVTRRWRIIAWLLKILPRFLYER
ncbi:MAG: SDR family NAD(P)-dependent oxidoreductase [Pedobacter sp.]|nr:SDR family NAD(P)-dependent oxidoreductase [Pedobacter sp.]MDQ8053369.1 SDR family NAD(P)-dependent oxidoreductase [Pedobacter sp.]